MLRKCSRCRREYPAEAFLDSDGVLRAQCDGCRAAGRARFKSHYETNKAAVTTRIATYRAADPERRRGMKAKESRNWRAKHPQKKSAANRKWRKENPGVAAALNRKRKAQIARATPRWADLPAIEAIYVRAARLRAEGHDVHVDHRSPIAGKNVCGLHTADNLRIVSKPFNLKKGNSHK